MRTVTNSAGRLALVMLGALIASGPAMAADQYQYDDAGRLASVTYYTGQLVSYTYDNRSHVTAIVTSFTTGVEPALEAPAFVNALRAGRPNPARGEARLRFSLARQGTATIRLFDVAGRLVRTVTDREYPAGEYEARVLLGSLPAGVYFCRLEAPEFRATRRLVVLK